MYLKSVTGDVMFEGYFHTVKKAVEAAVREGVSLDSVDLRYANLLGAKLDGATLDNACLWGAKLMGADMSEVSLVSADCRSTNFKDCCLVDSNLQYVDFRGGYFSQTLFDDADLSHTKFSCPSVFQSNLHQAKDLSGAIYSHRGEVDCDLSRAPIVIHGAVKPVVLMKENILIGTTMHEM